MPQEKGQNDFRALLVMLPFSQKSASVVFKQMFSISIFYSAFIVVSGIKLI